MKPLGQIANTLAQSVQFAESPIETGLFMSLMEHGKFVLCPDHSFIPQGQGYYVYPQYEIGPYRADFYIHAKEYMTVPRVHPFISEAKLVLECDGREFHSTPEQLAHDAARDKFIEGLGIKTLRLPGSEINARVLNWPFYIENVLKGLMRPVNEI